MSDRYANSSDIIPQVKKYKLYVSHYLIKEAMTGIWTTLNNLKTSLHTRYQKYLDQKSNIYATFLDPRYKQIAFKDEKDDSPSNVDTIELELIEEFIKYEHKNKSKEPAVVEDSQGTQTISLENTQNNLDEPADYEGFPDSNFDIDNWLHAQCFATESGTKSLRESTQSSMSNNALTRLKMQQEIEMYKKIENLPKNENPFNWWKGNQKIFPRLSILAQKYLSCPPSSVESERVFLVGGNIYTARRSRLRAELGEKLIFLNYNLRLFPKLEYKL